MAEAAAIAVQLYSVRDALANSVPPTLERLAGIGIRNVELFNIREYYDEYRTGLADNGLTAMSAHAPLLSGEAEPYLDAAATLGVTMIIEPFVPQERWRTRDDVQRTADSLNALVDTAAAHGLTIGYHNHAWEFTNQFDGLAAYELLASLVDPRVGLELDTYWATVGGADVPAVLRRLGSQVRFLHIKDGPTTPDYFDGYIDASLALQQRPAGQGAMRFAPILAAAPGATRVIEFDNYTGNIFEGIAASFHYLNQAQTGVQS
jgi:sugar phosphate isomerase/epimerase